MDSADQNQFQTHTPHHLPNWMTTEEMGEIAELDRSGVQRHMIRLHRMKQIQKIPGRGPIPAYWDASVGLPYVQERKRGKAAAG
jgi:hypothetical protein